MASNPPMTTYHLLIGCPGTGKSTVLNNLMGECHFDSKASTSGVTRGLKQWNLKEGMVYCDVPGMKDTDPELADKAVQGVHQCLNQRGLFKIFFLCTTDQLRPKGADLMTIQSVIKCLDEIENVSYGIIVNQLTKGQIRKLNDNNGTERVELEKKLNHPLRRTANFHYMPLLESLDSMENTLVQPDDSEFKHITELRAFADALPGTTIDKPIPKMPVEEFGKLKEIYDKLLEQHEQAKKEGGDPDWMKLMAITLPAVLPGIMQLANNATVTYGQHRQYGNQTQAIKDQQQHIKNLQSQVEALNKKGKK